MKILLGLKNLVDACRPVRLIGDDPDPHLSTLDRLDGLSGPDDCDDYDRIDGYLARRRRRPEPEGAMMRGRKGQRTER